MTLLAPIAICIRVIVAFSWKRKLGVNV